MPFLGFRWVVNFVLLAVPIGVTLGVLMGLDAGRSANGEKPLFTEPDNPGTIPKNNGITAMVSCDKAMGLHPLSKGQEYTPRFLLFPRCIVFSTGACFCLPIIRWRHGPDTTMQSSLSRPVLLRAVIRTC
ncbi:LOW QUALITY PROTEIN: xyloglucan-specific endoglucanase [Colletotrichum tofieldiae]|nr:LOW QUALITY PROTEIN: xyloglucan-specific endoglucanase [Colletotrichum tofieldiae]